jgi:hypothetical protein
MSDLIDADSSKKIDLLLKAHIAPFLKARKFTRKGRHFWRDNGSVIDTLNVQKSQWNSGADARFCINLGLIWPEVEASIWNKDRTSHPSADRSTVGVRLGKLITGRDYWWDVFLKTNLDDLSLEIVKALTDHALPWLERGHDPRISCEYLGKIFGTVPIETFKKIYQL